MSLHYSSAMDRQKRLSETPNEVSKLNEVHTAKSSLHFMSFPPEIRQIIYYYVFVKPTNIGLVEGGDISSVEDFFNEAKFWKNNGLLISCRQIYSESSGMFFGKNTFEFFTSKIALGFLEAIGSQGRASVKNIVYHHLPLAGYHDPEGCLIQSFFKMKHYLGSSLNLTSLELYVPAPHSDRNVVRVFEGAIDNALEYCRSSHTNVTFGVSRPVDRVKFPPFSSCIRFGDNFFLALFQEILRGTMDEVKSAILSA